MRVILDTNVFVSGIFWNGPPHEILNAWKNGAIKLVLSAPILSEYTRVAEILSAEHPPINLFSIVELLTLNAELCTPHQLKEPVSVDPDDDKFIACALGGKVKLIVSGDKDLLQINGYQG